VIRELFANASVLLINYYRRKIGVLITLIFGNFYLIINFEMFVINNIDRYIIALF